MVGTRFQRSHGRLPSLLFAVIAFTVLLIESRNHRAGVCADRVGLDPISAEGKGSHSSSSCGIQYSLGLCWAHKDVWQFLIVPARARLGQPSRWYESCPFA